MPNFGDMTAAGRNLNEAMHFLLPGILHDLLHESLRCIPAGYGNH